MRSFKPMLFADTATTAATLTDCFSRSDNNLASPTLKVSFDAAHGVLVVDWQGDLSSTEIRDGYEIVMEHVRFYRPKKLLLDFRNRSIIRRSDQRWVFSVVFPQILRIVGDTVFVAVVLPVILYCELVGEMEGDELMHDNNFLIINHALYREEAYRWLNSMHNSSIEC